MKYEVKMSCGHVETVELYGGNKDREYRISQLGKWGMCKDCYKAAIEKETTELENKYNLPELTGSEKQVAWAKKIRANMYKKFEEDFQGHFGDADPRLDNFKAWMKEKTEAKWFIDHRDESTRELVKEWKQG